MTRTTITINDIARELNVAPSTVSRALNNSPKISEKTKELIRNKASELGYDLNLMASGLSRNKTNIIGVLIPAINSHFFSLVVSGIDDVAHPAGYRVIIAQSNDSYLREQEVLRMFSATRVDGVIACLSLETRDVTHFDKIRKNGIPLVLFDRVSYQVDCPRIEADNYDGAMQAVSHLIKTGCKRIAHLAGPMESRVFHERARGFQDALKNAGLPLYPGFLLSTDLSFKDTQEAMRLWLSLPEPPDAIFASGADSGLLITRMAREAGIDIPSKLAVVAFGNQPANEYIVPALSSVEMPGYDMGQSAMRFLLNEIDEHPARLQTSIKPVQLIIRNSSFR